MIFGRSVQIAATACIQSLGAQDMPELPEARERTQDLFE